MANNYDEDFEDEYDDLEGEFDARRIARHRRRVRNQVLAYVVLIVLIICAGFGIYKGVSVVMAGFKNKAPAPQETVSVDEPAVSDNEPGIIASPDVIEEDMVSENEAEPEPVVSVPENAEARAYVDAMSTEQKVAGLFIVSPEAITGVATATAAGDGTKSALENNAVGGIIYSGKNVTGADQFKTMLQNTQDFYNELYNTDLFLVVREEGKENVLAGGNTGITTQPSALSIGNDGVAAGAYTAYVTIGNYLSEYGINVNIAPVCDVKTNESSVLGERSFGSDATVVSDMVTSSVDALNEMNVNVCLLAFPGYGDVTGNPVNGTVSTERTKEDMEQCEFLPFEAGIANGAEMVMVSHLVAENVTGESVPSSLSSVMITDILKGELGFTGIVITDSMNDGAITGSYSSGDAAVAAINAGADMILEPADYNAAYNAVLAAVNDGTISAERLDDALMRIYSVKFAE